MATIGRTFNAIGGRILIRTGRVGYLTTTGRRSGLPRTTPIGFVCAPGDRLLIGAGRPGTAWAANLRADPRCRFRTKDGEQAYRALEQTGAAHGPALAELKAGMGRSGGGVTFNEVFVLVPEEPLA